MGALRNWLWRRRYRKWCRSIGINLNPKRLMFSMSGVTDFMRGVGEKSLTVLDRWASGAWFDRDFR